MIHQTLMEIDMPINPETLKALREKRNLSQQALADRAEEIKGPVGKRTIARIETGETPPEKVRRYTLERLAKALDVKPEELCKPISEISDKEWKDRGFTPIKFLIPEDVRQNFRWVRHHYGLDPHALVEAAPWMAALLAEMSLAERKRRVEGAEASFKAAIDQMPKHLRHGRVAEHSFENAVEDEQNSLVCRDIFGWKVLEEASGTTGAVPFDPDVTNPFVEFLRRAAADIDHDALDPEELEVPYGSEMPRWPVFQGWLHRLTGGDRWARFAVENVKGVLDRMPSNLRGEDNTAERVLWLTNQIPPDMRAREEERVAALVAEFETLEITL